MKKSEEVRSIRTRQTELTRTSIIEALAEVIVEEGPLGFSVQSVADRAGVSHRTVYRYFPNRVAMCEGLVEMTEERSRLGGYGEFPDSLEGLLEMVPKAFEGFGSDRVLHHSLLLLTLSIGHRSTPSKRRDEVTDRMVERIAPSIRAEEKVKASTLIRYLSSSHTWMILTSQFGRTDREAAEAAIHGIRLAVEDLERCEKRKSRKK